MEDLFSEQKRIQKISQRISGIPKSLLRGGTSGSSNKITEDNRTKFLVKKLRSLTEQEEDLDSVGLKNMKTVYDQSREENNFKRFFEDLNVTVKFEDLKVYNDKIFWGGTIDNIIQFAYKVTPDENTSGVEFNYLEDFTVDNPDNQEIVDRIESYYNTFYKYWRNNILQ